MQQQKAAMALFFQELERGVEQVDERQQCDGNWQRVSQKQHIEQLRGNVGQNARGCNSGSRQLSSVYGRVKEN